MDDGDDDHLPLRPSPPPEDVGAAASLAAGKRQRRPSVRFGDYHAADSLPLPPRPRRLKPSKPSKPSKPFSPAAGDDHRVLLPVDDNLVSLAAAFGRRPKPLPPLPPPRRLRLARPDSDEEAEDEEARVGVFDSDEMAGGDGVRDVRSWLEELGLVKYVPVFEAHEVDEEVLPWLTMEDLTDMGIAAVGARRKLFCAIQKLRRSCNNS